MADQLTGLQLNGSNGGLCKPINGHVGHTPHHIMNEIIIMKYINAWDWLTESHDIHQSRHCRNWHLVLAHPHPALSNMRGNELYKIRKVNKHDCNSLVLFVWRSIHIYCINKKHNLIFILILPCSSPQQWLRKNKKLMNSRSKAGLLERSDIIISSFFV